MSLDLIAGDLMFRQENLSSPTSATSQQPPKTHHRKQYAILAVFLVIIIAVGAVLITQGNLETQTIDNPTDNSSPTADQTDYGSTLPLRLNYVVGEQMVYETTNLCINPLTDDFYLNATKTMRIISHNNGEYKVETRLSSASSSFDPPAVTTTLSKTSFASNFIRDGPPIFLKENANPIISAYLAQESVNVGDVWIIPATTGNSSLGVTGEVTLKFASIENVTVPAGTYKTMKIEITSTILNMHSDGTSGFWSFDGDTLQISGTTYLEQATCRLVKADLTQVVSDSQPTEQSPRTIYSETFLVNHTGP